MSIIALFNLAKEYFAQRKTNEAFRHLDNHYLKDLGFYRYNGQIRPLYDTKTTQHEATQVATKITTEVAKAPPSPPASDG